MTFLGQRDGVHLDGRGSVLQDLPGLYRQMVPREVSLRRRTRAPWRRTGPKEMAAVRACGLG